MGWTDYGIENAVEGVKKSVRADVPAQVPGIFVVRKIYDNEEKEEDAVKMQLIDKDTGEIILEGDYYHNHIQEQVNTFFKTLDYFDFPYVKEELEEVGE